MKKENKSIIGLIFGIILIIITISLLSLLKILDILPNKAYLILSVALIIITLLIAIVLFIKSDKKGYKIFKGFCYFINIILLVSYTFGIYYLNKTMNFIENIDIIKEEVTNYYIVVLNESRYQETSDLYKESLGYFNRTDLNILNKLKLDLSYKTTNDINELLNNLFDKKVSAILISDIIKNKYEEEDSNFNNKVKVLEIIPVTNTIKDITKKVSIKNTPFNILISGIDTSGDINITSRNDVNIVATVNPNTNEVLLTSIPRDYYVQIHGTTGNKDKLTHASYYGTNIAVQTIEDILDIDINYYVKVNFTTVVKLVDTLNGIDVYADVPINVDGCKFNVGYNHVSGKCALVFARERYSYADGDRHRGRNQQEVIKAVFNKLSSGTEVLTSYTNLLSAMNGNFATNMDMNEVINYLKYELNDLSTYDIESTQLDGYGSMGETYSYPGQNLWIMIPYEETITNAHNLIEKMLKNESIE